MFTRGYTFQFPLRSNILEIVIHRFGTSKNPPAKCSGRAIDPVAIDLLRRPGQWLQGFVQSWRSWSLQSTTYIYITYIYITYIYIYNIYILHKYIYIYIYIYIWHWSLQIFGSWNFSKVGGFSPIASGKLVSSWRPMGWPSLDHLYFHWHMYIYIYYIYTWLYMCVYVFILIDKNKTWIYKQTDQYKKPKCTYVYIHNHVSLINVPWHWHNDCGLVTGEAELCNAQLWWAQGLGLFFVGGEEVK